jgi:hypothetical protein
MTSEIADYIIQESFDSTEDTDNVATPTEFHLFSELPMELQQKIWDIYLPGPQRVIIESIKANIQRTGLLHVVAGLFNNPFIGQRNVTVQLLGIEERGQVLGVDLRQVPRQAQYVHAGTWSGPEPNSLTPTDGCNLGVCLYTRHWLEL